MCLFLFGHGFLCAKALKGLTTRGSFRSVYIPKVD